MNWIDDKYRDNLKEQKFPEDLKKKGWSGMEKTLDADMPVNNLIGKKGWFGIGGGGLLVVIAFSVWLGLGPDEKTNENPVHNEIDQPYNRSKADQKTDGVSSEKKKDGLIITIPESKLSNKNIDRKEHLSDEAAETESYTNTGQAEHSMDQSSQGEVFEEDEEEWIENKRSKDQPVQEEERTVEKLFSGKKDVLNTENIDLGNDVRVQEDKSPVRKEISTLFEGKRVLNTDNIDLDVKEENFVESNSQNRGKESNSDEGEEIVNNDNSSEGEMNLNGIDISEDLISSETDLTPDPELKDFEINDKKDREEKKEELAPKSSKESVAVKFQHLSFPGVSPDLPEKQDMTAFSREHFSVSLQGGYHYIGKRISAPDRDYEELRKEEQAIYTFSSGFNLDYFIDEHWTFGIGINNVEYGEVLNYSFRERDTVHYDGRLGPPQEFFNIISRDSTRIIDSINVGHWNYSIVHEYNDTSLNKYNGRTSWRYIELPFTVGYRFGKGRIKPWLRTGISVGIPVRTSYHYIKPGLNSFSELSAGNETAPIQYSYLLSLGLDCYVSRRISIRVNALGSMQLRSGIQEYGVDQRYYRLGGTLELGYSF